MTPDRSPLSTDPNAFCFIDTETRSIADVTVHGAYRHTAAPGFMVLIVTYAIGDGPVQVWAVEDFDRPLRWGDVPSDLFRFYCDAELGRAWFVAWNMAFDRLAINRGIINAFGPKLTQGEALPIEWTLDAMAQGAKSHLPPDLAGAAEYSGAKVRKDSGGTALIKLFCDGHGEATPTSHPQEWADFLSYAKDDIGALREVFNSTLPLSRTEWAEYWANERINDRGLPLDMAFVERASALAEFNAARANSDVVEISDKALFSVNQSQKMTEWVMERLDHLPRVHDILTKAVVEGVPDEDGNDVVEVKLSLERARVEEVVAYLENLDRAEGLTDAEFEALRMLEVRVYGASATPRKFTKLLRMADRDGRVRGQYTFNGAPATGRFSSRGIQTHNLTRATVEPLAEGSYDKGAVEIAAIETIQDVELGA